MSARARGLEETPLQVAEQEGQAEVAEYLKTLEAERRKEVSFC